MINQSNRTNYGSHETKTNTRNQYVVNMKAMKLKPLKHAQKDLLLKYVISN